MKIGKGVEVYGMDLHLLRKVEKGTLEQDIRKLAVQALVSLLEGGTVDIGGDEFKLHRWDGESWVRL